MDANSRLAVRIPLYKRCESYERAVEVQFFHIFDLPEVQYI